MNSLEHAQTKMPVNSQEAIEKTRAQGQELIYKGRYESDQHIVFYFKGENSE